MEAGYITSIILAIVSIVFGAKWRKVKKLIKEISAFVVEISEALEDDRISREELVRIKQKSEGIVKTARSLLGR